MTAGNFNIIIAEIAIIAATRISHENEVRIDASDMNAATARNRNADVRGAHANRSGAPSLVGLSARYPGRKSTNARNRHPMMKVAHIYLSSLSGLAMVDIF